jgi:hypothetical protein
MRIIESIKSRLPWVRTAKLQREVRQLTNTVTYLREDTGGYDAAPGNSRTAEGAMFDAVRVAEIDLMLGRRNGHAQSAPISTLATQESSGGNVILKERMAELELALEDRNWLRLAAETNREFSRQGLRAIMMLSRLFYLKNPLINRAVEIQALYVWGQGVSIGAKDEDINKVVQAFMDEPHNRSEMFGHQARRLKEVELHTMGNLLFCFFINASTGAVRLRTIPVDEIQQIHCNPDDAREPWFYERMWSPASIDPMSGTPTARPMKTKLYPDWRYAPAQDKLPPEFGNKPIEWDTPVMHVKVGALPDMRFGVPETYAGIDWARAYQEYLQDFCTQARSLARWAWDVTTKGGKAGVDSAKARLGTTAATGSMQMIDSNPPPVTASAFIHSDGVTAKPFQTGGMQASLEDGRRIALMVGSAEGIPETMLLADISRGGHATAKTLDRPTELKMSERQALWTDILKDILDYVIDCAALAPNGPLRGKIAVDSTGPLRILGTQETITQDVIDRHIDVSFPPVLQESVQERIGAIVSAATLDGKALAGTIPDVQHLSRMMLQALGEGDIDDLLQKFFPDGAPAAEAEKLVQAVAALSEAVKGLRGVKV